MRESDAPMPLQNPSGRSEGQLGVSKPPVGPGGSSHRRRFHLRTTAEANKRKKLLFFHRGFIVKGNRFRQTARKNQAMLNINLFLRGEANHGSGVFCFDNIGVNIKCKTFFLMHHTLQHQGPPFSSSVLTFKRVTIFSMCVSVFSMYQQLSEGRVLFNRLTTFLCVGKLGWQN